MTDLIKRDDALRIVEEYDVLHDHIKALPAIDPAAIREAALREAADACTYVIKNIEILKADGETYETPRIQKIARGLVDVARQDILALIGEKK